MLSLKKTLPQTNKIFMMIRTLAVAQTQNVNFQTLRESQIPSTNTLSFQGVSHQQMAISAKGESPTLIKHNNSFYHGKGTFQMAFTKPDPHWLYLSKCGLKTTTGLKNLK